MKQWKTAGVLVLILFGLGGLATYDEWATKKEEDDKKSKNKLVELTVDRINGVSYFAPAKEGRPPVKVEVVKEDGAWRMISPVDAAGDNEAIENFLKSVTEYSYDKEVATSSAVWDDYGVAKDTVTIGLKAGEETLEVVLGNDAPVGYKSYLRTSQSASVLIGSQHIKMILNKTMYEFRNKEFVNFETDAVTEFSLQSANGTIAVRRTSDSAFAFAAPFEAEADSLEVKEFLNDIRETRVTGFLGGITDATRKVLEDSKQRISLKQASGDYLDIVFGLVAEKLIAQVNGGHVVELGDQFKSVLRKQPIDFRNRKVIPVDANLVKSIQINGDKFRRVGGDWFTDLEAAKFDESGRFTGEASDKPTDKNHVRALIVDMEFGKTSEFVSLTDKRFLSKAAAPLHRIQVQLDTGKNLVIDLFAIAGNEDSYLVTVTDSNFAYIFPRSVFQSMTPSASVQPETDDDVFSANGEDPDKG